MTETTLVDYVLYAVLIAGLIIGGAVMAAVIAGLF